MLTNAEGREAAFCHNRQEAKNETETVKGKQPEASSKEQSGSQTGGRKPVNIHKHNRKKRESQIGIPDNFRYVIFITETDALGDHLPIYHISRKQSAGRDV